VSVFLSGRPLWVHPEINASDAFVAAFLPGSEGAGVADVLIRKADGSVNYDFKGKLSFSWPDHARHLNNDKKPLFKTGYGLTFEDTDTLGELHENPYPRESKLKRLYKKVCNFFFRN
jgi:beta-glucosidase